MFPLARLLIAFVQALPLTWVARLGRAAGALAYALDKRHRRVAQRNLTMCFGREKSLAEIRALARENFRRIGENFACAVKTAAMDLESLRPHVEFVAPALVNPPAGPDSSAARQRIVAAIGHFGNFELYARFGQFAPGYQCATTYRGLRQASLNRLLQSLRARSGCLFFERRFDAAELKAFMNRQGVILGLLSDQHAGDNGLRLPFLGHDCSTSAAPAVFALRYHCALYTGICYRVGLARWRIEAGSEIPTHEDGRPRSTQTIMLDVNRVFEAAVRRDPANWFWVHNRWKPRKPKTEAQSPKPAAQGQDTAAGNPSSATRNSPSEKLPDGA
jgi:KDO2-lipid IV(A) lauroyltransferase